MLVLLIPQIPRVLGSLYTGAVVQQWKETLRENFVRDSDNFESKEMLANLAMLSKIMNARKGDDDDE